MLGNIKIGLRLGAAFAIVVCIFSLLAVFLVKSMDTLGELEDSVDKRAKDAMAMIEAESRLGKIYGLVAESLVNRNFAEVKKTLAEYRTESGKDIEHATKAADTPEEKQAAQKLAQAYVAYLDLMEKQMLPMIEGDQTSIPKEIKALDEKIDKLRAEADKNISLISISLQNESKESSKQFDVEHKKARTLAITISLVACLVAIILSVVITLGITRPLRKGVVFATGVAEGDLDRKLEVEQKDEIGVLADALRKMVANLKVKIAEAVQKSEEAARETEKANLATDEANQAKAQAERAKAEGMMAAATQLEKVVEIVSSASEELSAQIEQSSRGTEVQSQRVGETATAMEEMNATVLEVAKNASQAADSSNNARAKALDGAKIVAQVVAGINTMQTVSLTMKEDMGVLGKQADGIGQIMNVISDIADQTNLLALNAAIEAARAGDAGRGFAVVADEVRKLAEKTQAATKEVGEAISGIQKGTKKNLENVERAVTTVEQATELANKSGEALQEIVHLVEVSTDQVRSIATASEEQSAASEEINRSIEEINRISSETASAMNQSAQAVGDLATQAGALRQLIEKMKSGG